MAYSITSTLIGAQPIAATSAVAMHPLGKIVTAFDPVYGEGEFIYLKGVASTAVGLVARFDQFAGSTTLTAAGGRGPVAVAMSANVANSYGWYQIAGAAVVKAATVVANAPVYATATAGQVDDAVVAGDKIDGMVTKTADGTPSAGFAVMQLDRPAMNGNG